MNEPPRKRQRKNIQNTMNGTCSNNNHNNHIIAI